MIALLTSFYILYLLTVYRYVVGTYVLTELSNIQTIKNSEEIFELHVRKLSPSFITHLIGIIKDSIVYLNQ